MSKFDEKINNMLNRYIFAEGCGRQHEDNEVTASPAPAPTKPETEPGVDPDTETNPKPKRRNPLRPKPGKKSKPMANLNAQLFLHHQCSLLQIPHFRVSISTLVSTTA